MAVMRAANSDVQRVGLRVLNWVEQKAGEIAECWDEMKVERIDLVIDLNTSHGKLVPNMLGRRHCLR
jgi:hypothetical protein